MATTATPYGFKPLNHIGGTPYAGAVRHIKIASGFGTNIFNGSIVNIVAAGTIEVVTDIGDNSDQFPASVAQAALGANAPLAAVQSTSTGDTTTGVSSTALDADVVTTATVAFRIVDFVESPDSTVGDAFTDLIVKFNAGIHSYENATGI